MENMNGCCHKHSLVNADRQRFSSSKLTKSTNKIFLAVVAGKEKSFGRESLAVKTLRKMSIRGRSWMGMNYM